LLIRVDLFFNCGMVGLGEPYKIPILNLYSRSGKTSLFHQQPPQQQAD